MVAASAHEQVVHLVLLRMDRLRPRVEELSRVLAEDEHARARRFRFAFDRESYAVGRAALRHCLAAHTGQRPEEVSFAYGEHGKPRLHLEQGASPLRFNASGSKGLAAIAIARGAELGVDIERRRELSDWRQLAARFFHELESNALAKFPALQAEDAFMRLWTLKEAVVKFTGRGLYQGLNSFAVSADPRSAPRLLYWSQSDVGLPSPGFLWTTKPSDDSFVSVASGSDRVEIVPGALPRVLVPAALAPVSSQSTA